MTDQKEPVTLITKISLKSVPDTDFFDWQAQFRAKIASAPGFMSLEISSPSNTKTCMLNQRFRSKTALDHWKKSETYKTLLQTLISAHLVDSETNVKEELNESQIGVTEVYVTDVQEDKIAAYQEWHKKIHRIESTFPGFQKVYIQAPNEQKENKWLTLLQFDTAENLEKWLKSPERNAILEESKDFVESRESHRLLSSFGGWFTDSSLIGTPAKWKQTALVLLVLFPVIMLQFLYLTPHLSTLNLSIRTFIQNVITVVLLAWPLMPITIYALRWWLNSRSDRRIDLLGCLCMIALYLLEIGVFWVLSQAN